MNNKIVAVLISVFLLTALSAQVQDLPDVEISGPSTLKTTLGKKGGLNNDLYLSDVVDSLKPLLVSIKPIPPVATKQKENLFSFDASNKLGIHADFLSAKFLNSPYSLTANANYYNPKTHWSQLDGKFGMFDQTDDKEFGMFVKTLTCEYPNDINIQYDNALNLRYYTKYSNLINLPLSIYADTELHSYKIDDWKATANESKYYWNGNLVLTYYNSDKYNLTLDAACQQQTPVVTLKADLKGNNDNEWLDIIKGLSLNVSDNRILPGIHISKRLDVTDITQLQIYQKSELRAQDNYQMLLRQPWQYGISKSLVTFKPLDLHVIMFNNPGAFVKLPVTISTDLGTAYLVDEPVYYVDIASGTKLPQTKQEGILQSSLSLNCRIKKETWNFLQTIKLEKGWLAAHSYSTQLYLPLVSLITTLNYKYRSAVASGWINQYYNTLDYNHHYLRESIDIGAQLNYTLQQDVTIYGRINNLLNKGKYVYKTIPTEPTSITLGLKYIF